MKLFTLSTLALILTVTFACDLVRNVQPLIDQEPTLLKSVANGQKLLIGDPKDPKGNYLYIANIKGTPREMGKALGELFAEEIKATLDLFYGYYIGALDQILEKAKIPAFMAKRIGLGV